MPDTSSNFGLCAAKNSLKSSIHPIEVKAKKSVEVVLVNKPSLSWRHYLWRCQSKLNGGVDDQDKANNVDPSIKLTKKCHHFSANGVFDSYKKTHPVNKIIPNYMDLEGVKNYLKLKGILQNSFKSLSVEDFRSFGHSVKVSDEVENEYCEEKSVSHNPCEAMRVSPLDASLQNKRKRCLHRKCNVGLFYGFNPRRCGFGHGVFV